MQSQQFRQELSDLILNISQQEREIEVIRQLLCEQPEFEPYAAFIRLDREKAGYLTAQDITTFLQSNNIYHTEAESQYFISQYDKDGDNRLVFAEFLYAVLPQDDPELRTIASQRPNYDVEANEYLTYDLEYSLSKLMDCEIKLGIQIQQCDLDLSQEGNIIRAFNSIDTQRVGYFDFGNIKQFLRNCNILPFDEEIICFIRRCDIDEDGVISYDEFKERLKSRRNGYFSPLRKKVGTPQREIIANPRLISPEIKYRLENSPAKRTTSRYTQQLQPQQQQYSSPQRNVISPVKASPLRTSPFREKDDRGYFSAASTAFSLTKLQRETPRKISASPKRFSPKKVYQQKQQQDEFDEEEFSQRRRIKSIERFQKQKKSPSKQQINELIVFAFKQFVSFDKEIELAKQDLALRPDFNLLDGFRILDTDAKGTVSAGEIQIALNLLGIFPNKNELYLLIRKFDKDNDGRLRYSDFAEAFTPSQTEYSSLLNTRPPKGIDKFQEPIEVFSNETRRLFIKLFRQLIDSEASSEQVRQRLNQNPSFSVHEAFKIVDADRDGLIIPIELRTFLEDNDVFLTEKQLNYLIDRFNVKGDGRITYSEFVQELTPKSTKYV